MQRKPSNARIETWFKETGIPFNPFEAMAAEESRLKQLSCPRCRTNVYVCELTLYSRSRVRQSNVTVIWKRLLITTAQDLQRESSRSCVHFLVVASASRTTISQFQNSYVICPKEMRHRNASWRKPCIRFRHGHFSDIFMAAGVSLLRRENGMHLMPRPSGIS